jgi:hypothetical protein
MAWFREERCLTAQTGIPRVKNMDNKEPQEASIIIDASERSEIIGNTFSVVPDPMAPLIAMLKQPQREQRNVVLFGAGVSRYAGYIIPKPPPLGRDLLRELQGYDPKTWGSLPEQYASQFERGFEIGMDSIGSGEIDWFPRLMRSLSAYFLCFWPETTGLDAYSRFVRALCQRKTATRTILSTLNYECVLEYATNIAGLCFANFNPEPMEGNASVWKLHGSCNFVPGPGIQVAGAKYDGSNVFSGGLRFLSPAGASEWLRSKNVLYSAMCMIAPGKPVQFAPEFFNAVQESWADRVNTAAAVLVAGARPHMPDAHIWSPLSATPATVGFIGSKPEYEDWLPHRAGRATTYLGGKFEEAVKDAAEFVSRY